MIDGIVTVNSLSPVIDRVRQSTEWCNFDDIFDEWALEKRKDIAAQISREVKENLKKAGYKLRPYYG